MFLTGNKRISGDICRRPSGAAGIFMLLPALVLLLMASCSSQQVPIEVPSEPRDVLSPETSEKPVYSIYLPVEDVTIAELEEGAVPGGRMLVMRFDRPGAWSIQPERFLLKTDSTLHLVPVQTYGSAGLTRADVLIVRLAVERQPGFLEGAVDEDEFFTSQREDLDLPEALVFLDPSLLDTSLYLSVPEGSRLFRTGITSLQDAALLEPEQIDSLSLQTRRVVDSVLEAGAAGGSRRGFRSIVLIPGTPVKLPDYSRGLSLDLSINEDGLSLGAEGIHLSFTAGSDGENRYSHVRIGDLGIFAGATPLLDPGLPEITTSLFTSTVLKKIGSSGSLKPSPVLWEGSFNAYRDERKRFLFYPGIFSYIPGQHPDLSERDVAVVSGMEQYELDGMLRGRSLITAMPKIHGGIPSFFAASPSPTDLEIAYRESPQLQGRLAEFLYQPAFFLWFD